MLNNNDLGVSLYKTWSATQRSEEIARLVAGYRAGLPVGILCKMTEAIAGNRKNARKHLHAMLTIEERRAATENESGGMQALVKQYLL